MDNKSFGYVYGDGELSRRAYNLAIGAILLYGFVINYFMCKYLAGYFLELNPWVVIIGYFILAFSGIYISERSDNAFISFIGYNLVVVPVGVLLSILLVNYDNGAIINAILVTGSVTFIMMVLSCIYPAFFLSLGRTLFVALLCVIIAEVIFIFIGIVTPRLWDMLVAGIFALYIGYDWAKAQQEWRSLDTAVDTCVALYLDIINLFIRILGSSSKSKKN